MLCLIAKLDETATGKLLAVRNAALSAAEAAKPLYGHLTLAAYVGDDPARFVRSCRELLGNVPPFGIEYDRIEVLEETAIIVAAPARSERLNTLHRSVAGAFGASLDRWTQEGRWHPHTTLFHGPREDLPGLAAKMAAAFAPFSASVRRIEFSRVLPDGFEIVDHVELER